MKNSNESKSMKVHVRKAGEGDAHFILNSWLKSFRNSHFAKSINSTVYFNEHHKVVRRLIKRSTILIACNPEDHNQIYGYLVLEKVDGVLTLHFAYTKQVFRKLGIQRQLLALVNHDFQNDSALYSHDTKMGRELAAKFNLVYHPYVWINYNSEEVDED
jgi:hypothetical protein